MKTSTVKKAAEKLGGQEWIRTTEAEATGLQPVPFGHLGTCPWQNSADFFSRAQGLWLAALPLSGHTSFLS